MRGDRATVLIFTAPAGLEEFLAEFRAASDPAARNQIAARHGIRFG